MPIIEPPGDSQHLAQGDVLLGVRLYATARGWESGGGESAKLPHKLCLVLSRSCAAAHKSSVVVAGIEKYPDKTPNELNSFAKVLDYLTTMRNGVMSPDVFYLGQLPGKNGRFCARLDTVSCIQIPTAWDELQAFLRDRRIGTLNMEFARDLHIRLFSAFARLGFNDEGWLPDDDLNWLVQVGQKDLIAAEAELQTAMAEKAGREADGRQYADKGITSLQEKVDSLKRQIDPYIAERSGRRADTSGQA